MKKIEIIASVFCEYSAVVLLALISLFTFSDVILRYLFSASIVGSNEITQLLMAGFITSGIVIATKSNKNISVSIFEDRFNAKMKKILNNVSNITCCIVFAFLTCSIVRTLINELSLGRTSELINIPYWLYSAVVAIFLFIITLQCALIVIKSGNIK